MVVLLRVIIIAVTLGIIILGSAAVGCDPVDAKSETTQNHDIFDDRGVPFQSFFV